MSRIHNPQNHSGEPLATVAEYIAADEILKTTITEAYTAADEALQEEVTKNADNIKNNANEIKSLEELLSDEVSRSINRDDDLDGEIEESLTEAKSYTDELLESHASDVDLHLINWDNKQVATTAPTAEENVTRMPSLTVATGMYKDSEIDSFNIKLPNLVIADEMFSGCPNLTTINSSFGNVISANSMFKDCAALETIKLSGSGFENLTDYTDILSGCTALKSFTGNLDSITDILVPNTDKIITIFSDCPIETIESSLNSLTSATDAFASNETKDTPNTNKPKETIKSFKADMKNIKTSYRMFNGSTIEEFQGDCRNLIGWSEDTSQDTTTKIRYDDQTAEQWGYFEGNMSHKNGMFNNCFYLKSIIANFDSLINGFNMFFGCHSLENVNIDFPSLKTAYLMFCKSSDTSIPPKLTSFKGNLNQLVDGRGMFWGNSSFTNFDALLPSLLQGDRMFSNCILNPMSVERILTSIPTYSGAEDDLHLLSIGIKEESLAVVNDITGEALDPDSGKLSFKGWTIYVNING